MNKAELSKLTIKLQEIEDPEKGHGVHVRIDGCASIKATREMLCALFETLEKQQPEAFIPAVMAFMLEDLSPEDL